MKLEFPIKHIEDNLVFGKDGTVWAYYFVSGFDYDFLDVEEKMIPFQRQISFLTNIGLDLDYQITPNPTDITNIIDRTILDMLEK